MKVILLERIAQLGQMGDTVTVKDGYARNFLLPKEKALRATPANQEKFESQRAQLEAQNLERRKEAEKVAEKLDGKSFIAVRSASERGQLYGSVSTRDIAEIITENGFSIHRNQIELNHPIKTISMHNLSVSLHPEVAVTVTINIARSVEEAERQAAGEDMSAADRDEHDHTSADNSNSNDNSDNETSETEEDIA